MGFKWLYELLGYSVAARRGLVKAPWLASVAEPNSSSPAASRTGPMASAISIRLFGSGWLLEVNPLLGAGEKSATRACALACRIVYFHYAPLKVSSDTVKSDMRIMIVVQMLL